MKSILMIATVGLLVGCSTLSPRAQKIQVHKQYSEDLNSCKKLGRVDSTASGNIHINPEQQAVNNLRDQAAAIYPDADSVVILNVDVSTFKARASATGVAYKCY